MEPEAAHLFSVGFYKGLAAEKSIEQAYEMGCIAIQIWSATQSQSTQSRKYRKFEPVGDEVQTAKPQLAEYLKPVLLKKSELFPSNSTGSGSVSGVPPASVLSERPQEFFAYIRQEIDRKQYKDNARNAYDNFGRYSEQNQETPVKLDKEEKKQREIFVNKVKQSWIDGFLEPDLKESVTKIDLRMENRPDAIYNQLQGIEELEVELDKSYESLQNTQTSQEIGQGKTLLILGEPGAGKTIALLKLAKRLLERSQQDLTLRMPVVFNLSSWASKRKAIFQWLIDELREKYQVPKSISEPWLKERQLILLLDGLDEVKEKYRNDCVEAINKFIEDNFKAEVAVCSRIKDYEALTARLKISSAICLQPLTKEQTYEFFDKMGGNLNSLKILLHSNEELEKLASNPLLVNVMSFAYQGKSVQELNSRLLNVPEQQQKENIFDDYIDYRLHQNTEIPRNYKGKVIRWLRWLASQMVKEKQTIFLIEKLQPTWLNDDKERFWYRAQTFLITWLIIELTFGPIFVLMFGLIFLPIWSLMYGLIFTTIFGLILGLIPCLSKKIDLVETLIWSLERAKSRFIGNSIKGFAMGLSVCLIFALIFNLITPSLYFDLNFGIHVGIILGLVFALASGLGDKQIEQRNIANQGIRQSGRNCLIFVLTSFLISYPINVLMFDPEVVLFPGAIIALPLGLFYGGIACIQHFTLRWMLYRKKRMPWNYAKFLDFCAGRKLMKKIGGGYVFYHRMLLEHFAQMKQD